MITKVIYQSLYQCQVIKQIYQKNLNNLSAKIDTSIIVQNMETECVEIGYQTHLSNV